MTFFALAPGSGGESEASWHAAGQQLSEDASRRARHAPLGATRQSPVTVCADRQVAAGATVRSIARDALRHRAIAALWFAGSAVGLGGVDGPGAGSAGEENNRTRSM